MMWGILRCERSSSQFQPTGIRHGKREIYSESCAREGPGARDGHDEFQTSKDLYCSGHLGASRCGLARERNSAGTARSIAGGTATATIITRCAAARTDGASEAAKFDFWRLEAQSR